MKTHFKMPKPHCAIATLLLALTEPPFEAFDRCEAVVLAGETAGCGRRMPLPSIRADAGGFLGFGEHDGPQLRKFEGRFARMLPPQRPSAEGIELARAMLAAMGVTEERLRGNAGWN
jgi:hypothetical protein